MQEKVKISLPIIVEGRYDKSALLGFLDATVITTGGFSIFNNKEKQSFIKRLGGDGIILLVDSDGGGVQIRSFLNRILPKDKIHNLYIPKIEGKEARKKRASKAGTLGVEGMEKDVILRLLEPFADGVSREPRREVSKLDFYLDGISGDKNSSEKRARLAEALDLPTDMTANALLEAVNLLCGYEEYKEKINVLFGK